MKCARMLVALCVVGAMCSSRVHAQPKPGPEFAPLKKLVGTWDLTVDAFGQEFKGTASAKMDLGGLWLITSLKVESLKLEQKGMVTYDADSKKYLGLLANSLSTSPMVLQGTYDETARQMTSSQKKPGPDGTTVTDKFVMVFKNDDTIIQKISVEKDGKEKLLFTFTYTRKD